MCGAFSLYIFLKPSVCLVLSTLYSASVRDLVQPSLRQEMNC